MNRYNLTSVLALLALIIMLPFYARHESNRLAEARAALQDQYIMDASALYLQSCAECHGTSGEGLGANPALNKLGLSQADPKILFKTIARAAHGSAMAAWHIEEGGMFDDLQIEKLVTLIRFGDWSQITQFAATRGVSPKVISTMGIEETYLKGLNEEDPHQCISCHEEPEVHAERFGLDCVRCHSLVAWTPALLTRHTFALDHGDAGMVSCEPCHIESYVDNTCYECHDHDPAGMEEVHTVEGLVDFEDCISCHPTGAPDEARELMEKTLGEEISQGI